MPQRRPGQGWEAYHICSIYASIGTEGATSQLILSVYVYVYSRFGQQQFWKKLTKVYVAETSQLSLIAMYMLKTNSLVVNNVAMSLYDITNSAVFRCTLEQ